MLKRIDNGLEFDTSDSLDSKKHRRVHSINSLLKDQTYNAKPDIHSFRKLARMGSWFFSPWTNEEKNLPNIFDAHNPEECESFKILHPDTGRLKNIDIPYTQNTRPRKDTINHKPSSNELTKRSFLAVADQNRPSLPSSYRKRKSFKTLGEDALNCRRIIIIKQLPKNSSLNGIINRICGGPLERIVFHENREDPSVELYFIFPKDAQAFFDYGNTGLFIYNGSRMVLEWANETNTEDISLIHPKLLTPLSNQITNGARRSLLFVKSVPNKMIQHRRSLYYPDPENNYSKDFNIKLILRDFASLGNVIDVSPIISTKLSFCIHFSDIRSAIAIKRQCETEGTKLHQKYRSWSIHFVKDVTDKPCLQV